MAKKSAVPEVRFKGFEGEWEERTLGDETDIIAGGDVDKSRLLESGRYPVLANALTSDGVLGYYNDSYRVEAPAVTITGRGDVGHARARNVNFTPVVRLLALKSKHDTKFIENLINNNSVLVESTGVPQLTAPQLQKYKVYFTYGDEQTRIGELFRNLDARITLEQRKHEKLQNIKKAMLEKMFPKPGATVPEVRFKGFGGKWGGKRLGEVADIVRGASPRPIKDPKWFDDQSDVGWLRISDVTEQDGRITHLEQRISGLGQEKTRVLLDQHLLLSIAATIGKPVVNYVKTGVHDGFLIFQNPSFEHEFMFQWLDNFRPHWKRYGQPGSQVNLNSDLVKNHKMLLPKETEQTRIGDFFRNLDRLLSLQQRKCEKLQNIKKAMLGKMFV